MPSSVPTKLATSLVVLLFALPVFAQTYSPPQTVNEIEDAIETVEDRIEQLEEEIEEYREEVVKIERKKDTLQNKLDQIETDRKKIVADVELTDEKISHTQLTLAEIREGIERTEKNINTHQHVIAESLRRMYAAGDTSLIEMYLSGATLAEIFRERNMDRSLRIELEERVLDLRFLRADLNERKKEFLTEAEELEELKGQILDQKAVVEESRRQQTVLLRETQHQETQYQSLIAERQALRKAFEQELFEYESKLVFLLDPDRLPARGSGVLSFPLDNIVVTQMFGAKTGPHRTYANGHSGVDFRGNGDPVYAMADGVVLGVGDTDQACRAASFGKWILVKFDNNLAATYAHLSVMSVSAGQRVSRGQIIGYSGNTGRSTAPHLHISLYAAIDAEGNNPVRIEGKASRACKGATLVQPRAPLDAYLDVLDYLPALKDENYKAGVR